jgi:hypothetical protein
MRNFRPFYEFGGIDIPVRRRSQPVRSLSPHDIKVIKAAVFRGVPMRTVAAKFSTSQPTVSKVTAGDLYGMVGPFGQEHMVKARGAVRS